MIDRDEVLRYLGVRDKAQADPQTLAEVEALSSELEAKLSGRWIYNPFPVEKHTPDGVWLQGLSEPLMGKDIAKLLAPCDTVYLMACTLGPQAERLITLKSHLSPTAGLIADACASALTEAWCDKCEAEIRSRAGNLTFRYSPGYGDLSLKIQKPILEALVAHKRIGLSLSDSYLLTPRKSVVAILGVLPEVKGLEQEPSAKPHRCGLESCDLCPLKETCTRRR
ncbi:hypothetical protein [Acidaminobacter hydrogenoformans]|uniref:Vitamin B12 dependent methionine synthase, activation domain n=1 Tax=Acidaminobacter hydrogenoformans DSM 2784 TaxID=1120920 RepID=A0A1G5S724_9FIRM|nr:hypothetical protein [Acidaminobacter hydrogenoformans]SCZ81521.1 hypothetical protein SAMN03080599_02836 [Acidaminobacter hydrogenoformans DSM 2784]